LLVTFECKDSLMEASLLQLQGRPGERQPGIATRLNELFEASCDRAPGAIALECGERRLSYRELDEHANRLAHLLLGLGLGAWVSNRPGSVRSV
jgi:non-ribosomal peptide synthetase component F